MGLFKKSPVNICRNGGDVQENAHTAPAKDKSAENLTHNGKAVYDAIRFKHPISHHEQWNVTGGKVVKVLQTPVGAFESKGNVDAETTVDLPKEGDYHSPMQTPNLVENHSHWLADYMGDVIEATKHWCDIMSLSPPDGYFMTQFNRAIRNLHEKAKDYDHPVTLRLIFGNILGSPINCDAVLKDLMEGIPADEPSNLNVWVASWRKGTTWNHAKIIAVDGTELITGGHNLYDEHYLRAKPVHDISVHLRGPIAFDGHNFANKEWKFVRRNHFAMVGQCMDTCYPTAVPSALPIRVGLACFPAHKKSEHPPLFSKEGMQQKQATKGSKSRGKNVRDTSSDGPVKPQVEGDLSPVIAIGRYGTIIKRMRPSDDALVAMLSSARTSIRLVLQDVGPMCFPNSKIPIPGTTWPDNYLNAIAKALWEKKVDVEIVLSNPYSLPGDCKRNIANEYGNGWTCADLASEIIKRVRKLYPVGTDADLRNLVAGHLRITYVREANMGRQYEDGEFVALHAKHYIVDDSCCYIGSQNLYVCDLAEWGVVIDDPDQVKQIQEGYWNLIWKASYNPDDCQVHEVMDGLDIDRESPNAMNRRRWNTATNNARAVLAVRAHAGTSYITTEN
jgi:phosphatidylserine/phosphatidylglycerophosphate/cardiolipin synthase-like enzyme